MSATPPDQPVDSGHLGSSGSPCIKIKVRGALPDSAQEFEAIIDTGFTGFLAMPMVQAFPLGLILFGTTNVVLADGSTDTKLTALGTVELESGAAASGLVILEPNPSDVLVGMEFLNQFERTLILIGDRAFPDAMRSTAKPALLVSNTIVRQLLDAIEAYAKEQAQRAADERSQATLALGDPGAGASPTERPPEPKSN